jgi:quercetin dioxygenase-like cupin family protein
LIDTLAIPADNEAVSTLWTGGAEAKPGLSGFRECLAMGPLVWDGAAPHEINFAEVNMKRLRLSEIENVPVATATPIEGWTGGEVKRTRQPLLMDGASKHFSSSVVNFGKGATTGWHTHKTDQILVVTSGNGIVANETEQVHVAVGDVVHILAGENHWHGATKDSIMGHITITGVSD